MTVQTALKRLPPKEAYDRVFRIRRAFQVCFIIWHLWEEQLAKTLLLHSALFRTPFFPSRSTPSPAR